MPRQPIIASIMDLRRGHRKPFAMFQLEPAPTPFWQVPCGLCCGWKENSVIVTEESHEFC